MSTLSLGPVARQSRINAIDVARGFALLGILSVNIKFFAEPFGQMMQLAPPEGVGNMVVHYFTKIFCEGKFYPLFSMLFGMGLMLQRGRADEAGRSIYKPYLRRLAALFLFGLTHALLLWFGDVLFFYSLAGTMLLLVSWCRPRTLLIIAGAVLAVSLLVSSLFVAVQMNEMEKIEANRSKAAETTSAPSTTGQAAKPEAIAPPASNTNADPNHEEEVRATLRRLFNPEVAALLIRLREVNQQPTPPAEPVSPGSAIWKDAEQAAFAHGGFLSALVMRGLAWLLSLIFSIAGFFWQICVLFCLGGALLKLRFFDPDRTHWRKRAIVLGVVLGLPLSAVGVFGLNMLPDHKVIAGVAMNFGVNVGGPLMALAYISIWATLVERGVLSGLTRVLANTGRMALTNYLGQTLICTTIFYWYGLGLFGSFNDVQRFGVVLAVYAVELAWSSWWLARFRFGPMEWLWRTITYWKLQPMRQDP